MRAELLGLQPVGLEVGDDVLEGGRNERESVGGAHPYVSDGILGHVGDLVAGHPAVERVRAETLPGVVAHDPVEAGADPQRAVASPQQARRAAQRPGRHAVGRLEVEAAAEIARADGEDAPARYGGQQSVVVERDDVLHVAAGEEPARRSVVLPYENALFGRGPHPFAGVFAEPVDRGALRQQRVSGDAAAIRRADHDAVVDVDPQPFVRARMQRFDAVAGDPRHEIAVRDGVPQRRSVGIVGQQPLVAAPDPQRAVFPGGDGVDVFALRQPRKAGGGVEVLALRVPHRVAPVSRADPDVVLRVAEPAPEIARVAQMEPIGDVVFGDAVRDVEHVDVAALGADVDRSGPIRKEHGHAMAGHPVRAARQGGVGRGLTRLGIEYEDSLLQPEPDAAERVAATAPEFRCAGQGGRVAEVQIAVVAEECGALAGQPAPQMLFSVGFEHGGAVAGSVFPLQDRAVRGVHEHHAARAVADDPGAQRNDAVQPAAAQDALESVVPRIVGADAAVGDDPQHAGVIDVKGMDPVVGKRIGLFRFVLIVTVHLAVVAAEPVVGGDPHVPDLILHESVDRQIGQMPDELRSGLRLRAEQTRTQQGQYDCCFRKIKVSHS